MARVTDTSGTPATTTTTGGQLNEAFFNHSTFIPTDGWYVALACGVGVATANTRFGKISFGILTVALIYQLSQWVQGK